MQAALPPLNRAVVCRLHILPSTGQWLATELQEGHAPSNKSDVFGFGGILYELVMDDLPNGKRSSEAGVMNAKFQGIRPFDVPKEIQQLWPEDVLEIMVHCCSSH